VGQFILQYGEAVTWFILKLRMFAFITIKYCNTSNLLSSVLNVFHFENLTRGHPTAFVCMVVKGKETQGCAVMCVTTNEHQHHYQPDGEE
jgi:hypothetical protein